MNITGSVTLSGVKFDKLSEQQIQQIGGIVRKSAFDIEANAKVNTSPNVDTGFLRSSIYTVTDKGSRVAQAQKSAGRVKRAKGRKFIHEVPKAAKLEAYVAVGAEYGIYLEYGTSRSAAYPFLGPATETVRPQFNKAIEQVMK